VPCPRLLAAIRSYASRPWYPQLTCAPLAAEAARASAPFPMFALLLAQPRAACLGFDISCGSRSNSLVLSLFSNVATKAKHRVGLGEGWPGQPSEQAALGRTGLTVDSSLARAHFKVHASTCPSVDTRQRQTPARATPPVTCLPPTTADPAGPRHKRTLCSPSRAPTTQGRWPGETLYTAMTVRLCILLNPRFLSTIRLK
jgi:hypothetical protein